MGSPELGGPPHEVPEQNAISEEQETARAEERQRERESASAQSRQDLTSKNFALEQLLAATEPDTDSIARMRDEIDNLERRVRYDERLVDIRHEAKEISKDGLLTGRVLAMERAKALRDDLARLEHKREITGPDDRSVHFDSDVRSTQYLLHEEEAKFRILTQEGLNRGMSGMGF